MDQAPPNRRPTLIAHRGYPQHFPENTLVGFQAAVSAGAAWVETDIQLSRDGVPMLYHDVHLERTSDVSGRILDRTADQLRQLDAAEARRWGARFRGEPIPRLSDFVDWMQTVAGLQAMIELKTESLLHYGVESTVERVLRQLEPIAERCVVISFNLPTVRRVQMTDGLRVGWVLSNWDASYQQLAVAAAPQFLVASRQRLPVAASDRWPGPWQWVVYAINEPDVAYQYHATGIDLVETDAIGELLADERFRRVGPSGTV